MTEKVKEFCAKKVNKAIALMLTLAMVFTMVPALAFPVFAEGNKIIVVDGSTGGYALTAAGVNSAINAAVAGGTVYINGMVDVDNIIIVNKSITISGDSGSILLRKNTYAGKMISVSSWADLTIDTITIDGNNVSNSNSVIMTSSNSTLTMNSGCIKNNICFGYGSAINNSGMFIMNGGSILSNKTGYYGSALSNNGTFIMNSGTISDNMANMGGGGVYNINNATINGGTISGNTAKSGGGVYDGGIFKVSGTACVTGNKKSDGTVNNVYITSGKTITLTDNNYSGSVGINMDTTGTAIVADIGVTLTSDHKDQFFIDNMARGSDIYDAVLNNNDNQIEVQKIGGSQIKTAGNLSDLNFAISGAANDTMTYINITDDIPVTSQISISAKNITLYSSTGKSLTRGSSDIILFNVSNSSKFAIRDLTIDGRKDTFTDNTKTLIYNNNSKVILNPGTVLTNNTASYGSAINNYGTLLMNDGSISKNVATGVSGNYGSIYNNGTFTLNGGNISEGTNIGVFNYGSLYMNGGSIIKMASTIVSGGVNNNGTFAMSGGIISGNTAIYGGGVNNNGTFTMSGGIISGNTASSGGGVYNNSTFNIKGASNITDNYNIYPSVNNVEIATDKTMTVTGALNGTIGVTMRTYGTAAKGTVDYKITENDVKCFKSDASGYEVTKVDNSIKIAVPAPKIATQPQSFTKKIGETAKFSVVATNVNTYQWQVNKNDEKGFQNINDATSADYSVVMSADMDGYKYQCVVTGAGGSVTSDTATLNLFTYKVTINAGSGTATYNGTTKNSIDMQVPDGKSLGDMGITFAPLADYVVSGFTDVTIIDSIKTYSSLSEIKPTSDMSINVNYKKTPALALSVSTDKPTYRDTLTLTATLSKIANVNNVSLDFYNGETKIGFVTTNDKGVATITYDVTSLDSLNFSVKYAGDDDNTANVATLDQLTVAKKALTVNVSIKDKQYDGLNTAEFNQAPTLVGVASGDSVSLTNVTPTFASVNVEDIININFTDEFTISGTDANNYTLIQPTGITASIYNNYTAVKDTDYTVTTNDWANTAFEIKAKPGYMVSMRDIANSNYWHDQNSSLMFEGETANGKVNFYVKNTATGAISKVVTETFKIDQTKPENVTVSYQDNGWKQFLNAITFGLFFKDTITVKITATDTLSGVKEFKYTIGGAEQTIVATDGSAEFNIQPQYKGNISGIKAIDNAGKESVPVSTEHFAIDKIAPSAPTVNLNGYTSNSWTDQNVNITISGSVADSGIAKYQYSTDGGTSWIDMTATEETSATATTPYNATEAKLAINMSTNAVSYLFRAVSNAGNEGVTSSSVVVKIDTSMPAIRVLGDISTYKQSDKVTVTPIADISGISKVEVKKDIGEYADITSSYTNGYTVTENGLYIFRVTNGAGVTKTDSITYANIDTVKPVVSIDSNGYTENTWCNSGNITLSVSNTSSNLGTTTFEYKIGAEDWQEYTEAMVISSDCNATIYTFRATSASGVVSAEKAFTVKRDTTLSEGDINFNESSVKKFINAISFGLFFKDTINVKITSNDTTSGVKTTEYYKSETILDQSGVEAISDWITGTGFSLTPADKEKFVIYVKITDNADNVTYFGSDGTNFDTTAPTISGIANDGGYYTSQKVTVFEDNLDALTIDGAAFTNGNTIEGNVERVYSIVATDKAGNITTYTVTMKLISSISDPINSLSVSNVKSSDKSLIETVKTNVAAVDITNATQSEKDELNAITAMCNDLLEKIADTAAEIARINNAVDSYSIDTVKSSDKASLEKLVADIDILKAAGNVTADELTALNWKKDIANALLTKIADTAAEIARINNVVDSYSIDTVKSSDKASLEKLISEIDKTLVTEHLTDEERTLTNTLKATVNELLVKIKDVETASDDAKNKALNVTKENVNPSDRTSLEESKAALEKALISFSGNYTKDETGKMKERINEINEALKIINNAQGVVNKIKDLPDVNNVTKNDADTINEVKKAYDALTDYEKSLVDTAKLNAMIDALNKLDNTDSPQTGDNSSMLLWIALLFVSGGILVSFGVSKKRKKTSEK